MQGINGATTGISSMHVDHKADKSNRETEYNSESDKEDGDDSEPTPGACFHQFYHHMNNDAGRLNPYWILLDNQITLHMFSNRALLANIQDADEPIDAYSSGGITHCSKSGTLKNIGEVYLHRNGLENFLSYAKVRDKHNIAYNDVQDISPSINLTNGSVFEEAKGGYTIITANLTARSMTSHSCTMLKKINKASQIDKSGTHKRQDLHTT